MAVVTVANRLDTVMGNQRVLLADISVVADTNTLATGFQKVNSVSFTPQTAVAWGATLSGGTITFAIASGTLAGKLMVVGT